MLMKSVNNINQNFPCYHLNNNLKDHNNQRKRYLTET